MTAAAPSFALRFRRASGFGGRPALATLEKLGAPPMLGRMLRPVAEVADDVGEAPRRPRDGPPLVDPEQLRRRAEADALDRDLVVRAQAGNRAALGELLHKYGPGLYRSVLLPRLGSEANAREALSETYAKVVANIAKFTWQNVGFYPWLRTVALRVALDQLRAKKRLVLFEEDDLAREIDAASTATPVDQQISDQRDREAARAKVEAALGLINARYATAIRLRVLEERSREEVSTTLGVTPATFDVLLHRAIASLKKTLESASTHDTDDEKRNGDG